MSDGFEVDAVVLHAHAGQVDALAARMRTAAAAARPLDLDAYGLIGQVFAGAASEAARAGSVVVAGLAEQAEAIADGVRASGAAYRGIEDSTAVGWGGGQ